jgi:gluconolactonase
VSSISIRSPRLLDVVDADASVERLATGFVFVEGPVWDGAGGYLLFSDIPADVMLRWDPAAGVGEARRPHNQGNGMTRDGLGRLVVCEHATHSVVRREPDGSWVTLASHFGTDELNSPNDVVVGADASVYFTDPTYGRRPAESEGDEHRLGFRGVFRIDPRDGEVHKIADDFAQPNGLCFSPDESTLYVNDTERAHIRAFSSTGGGPWRDVGVFFEGLTTGDPADGVADGMKADRLGNLYVTGPRGIWVVDPAGEHLGVIEVPEVAANLAWGGPGWKSLFVTATTSLYRIDMRVAGRVEPHMR